jgi:general secretion pathway protein G
MLLHTVRHARRTATRRAGFTLLEVLVVVAILVILASIGVFAYMRYLEDAKKNQAQLKAKAIATAVSAYTLHTANVGNMPPENLGVLINPGFGTSFLENGEQDLLDPWGGQFQLGYVTEADGITQLPLVYTRAKDGTMISQYGMGDASKVGLLQ